MYKKVHKSSIPAEEIEGWTAEEFLSNSGVMRDGQLTRAAIFAIRQTTLTSKIHPAVAQITWTWEDKDETVIDYEHFTIPFILTVDKVLARIRNKTMRIAWWYTLPDTMKQYDDYTPYAKLSITVLPIKIIPFNSVFRLWKVTINCTIWQWRQLYSRYNRNALEHKGPQRHYRNECLW